jgi:hypothetical protein
LTSLVRNTTGKKIIQEMSIMIENGWEAVGAQEPFCREENNSNDYLYSDPCLYHWSFRIKTIARGIAIIITIYKFLRSRCCAGDEAMERNN